MNTALSVSCLLAGRLLRALLVLLTATVSINAYAAGTGAPEEADALHQALAKHLACFPISLIGYQEQKPMLATREFCLATIYLELGARPLWVSLDGPGDKARTIVEFITRAGDEGLDPVAYQLPEIMALWESRQPDDLAQLDTLISYNAVKYIHDMSFGQLIFYSAAPELFTEAGNVEFNPVAAVEACLEADDLAAYLHALAPRHRWYRDLKLALARLRAEPEQTGWTVIDNGPLIRPGDTDPRVPAIRQNLGSQEQMSGQDEPSRIYDEGLVAAITAFQGRHGLKADGIVGPNTLAALNLSKADKINIVTANMARWRWQDHDLGETFVMVNIADFSLVGVEKDKQVLALPVIVGRLQHQTPVFSDTIKYLDFNPYWNIPPSIARDKKLPALRENPNFLVEEHIRLFSSWQEDAVELDSTAIDWNAVTRGQMAGYKLRQEPGPWNALGQVKFIFPNHHSVYLHDTPARELFDQSSRSFSSGCIRVGSPLSLALFALKLEDASWTMEKIEAIVDSGERRVVRLSTPLPVHLTYQTAWLDSNGDIRFNRDVYERDAALLAVLNPQ
jgi:murein L,D-transpeptidase YcbB/YkuD